MYRTTPSSAHRSRWTAAVPPRFRRWQRLWYSLAACAVLSAPAGAQELIIDGNDEYAQLIFEAVAIPDGAATTDANLPGAATPDSTAAASGSGADPGTPANDQRQSLASIESAIEATLADEGLYSPQLRERYQQLGALQQQLGQHDSAITTLEKSVHIARVNGGLYTLDQEVDVQRIIASLEALGDGEREADYRAYLYYMQQRAYAADDPRFVAAKLAWADWNLHEYQRSAMLDPRSIRLPGGEHTEELVVVRDTRSGEVRFVPRRHLLGGPLSTGALGDPARYSLSPEMVIDSRLREAREIYEDLLASDSTSLTAQQREQLQLQLVAAEYTLKRQMERLMGEFDASASFFTSAGSSNIAPAMLRRGFGESRERLAAEILALESATPADPLALATAYLRQADLHVAYDERRRADEWYLNAWNSLLQAGLDTDAATAWLQGGILQPVPAFAVHPYSRALFGIAVDDTLPWRGYIDVSLNLTRDGNVRSADITAASAETPQRLRRLLLSYLRNQKMRPRLEQGVPVMVEDLRLRFNYSY